MAISISTTHASTLTRMANEVQLREQLFRDLSRVREPNVLLFAGHFPINVNPTGQLMEGFDTWGCFSGYSLELAAEAGVRLREKGKNVFFVIFCDDHSFYEPETGTPLNMLVPTPKIPTTQIRTQRRNIFRMRSGKNAALPNMYHSILKKYGFDERNILRHDQGRQNRHDCLYFSEVILRANKRYITNSCVREYVEFLEGDYIPFTKGDFYLVGFIPQCCQSNICNAVDAYIHGFRGIHVFMETTGMPSREEIYHIGRGVQYKRDD